MAPLMLQYSVLGQPLPMGPACLSALVSRGEQQAHLQEVVMSGSRSLSLKALPYRLEFGRLAYFAELRASSASLFAAVGPSGFNQ